MLESMVGFNLVEHNAGHTFEPPLGPAGYERSMVEYRRPYATRDGFVCVLPYNTKQWQAFFTLMDKPDMLADARVTDGQRRSEAIGELYAMVAQCVAGWDTEPLLLALEQADVPNGRAVPLGELADDPHLAAVGLFKTYAHPTEGNIRLPGPGVSFSKTKLSLRSLPDTLGQHSVEVLREVGYTEQQVADLVADGVTVDGR